VLDVGHNPQAATYVAEQVKDSCEHCVLAMLSDKNPAGVVESLPFIKHWALAGIEGFRGQAAAELKDKLPKACSSEAELFETVAQALQSQCKAAGDGETILVLGSFLTINEAKIWLGNL